MHYLRAILILRYIRKYVVARLSETTKQRHNEDKCSRKLCHKVFNELRDRTDPETRKKEIEKGKERKS